MPAYPTTNLTNHFSSIQANNAFLWESVSLSGNHPDTDGDIVNGIENPDNSSGNAWFGLFDTNGPIFKPANVNNLDAIRFQNSGVPAVTFSRLKDHTNTTLKAMSDLFGASARTLALLFKFTDDATNNAVIYRNAQLFGGGGAGRFGLFQTTNAGQDAIVGWNDYSFGTGDSLSENVTRNAPHTVVLTYDGTDMKMYVDKGNAQSIATQNTTDLTETPTLGGNSTPSGFGGWVGNLVEGLTYNAALTGSDLAQLRNYLNGLAGLLGGKGAGGSGKGNKGGGGNNVQQPGGASYINFNPGVDVGITL